MLDNNFSLTFDFPAPIFTLKIVPNNSFKWIKDNYSYLCLILMEKCFEILFLTIFTFQRGIGLDTDQI